MKRVKIFEYKIGLVFRKGNFVRVLTRGTHWLWLKDHVVIYDMTKDFVAPCELDILMQNHILAAQLEVIEVKDHEIALQFKNDNFQKVLGPGKYASWLSISHFDYQIIDLNDLEISEAVDKTLLHRNELIKYIRVFVVESYEEGLLFVDGKLLRKMEPGVYYFWKNTKAIAVKKVDLRLQQLEVSGQEMLTKDKAALRLNFYAQYEVINIEKALIDTKDFAKQLYILLQLGLREYVGLQNLDELLARKEDAQSFVLNFAKAKAEALGVALISCGIRDIILPGEVKEIMNQVLVAQKQAQANLIFRREETASTRSLLNTAKLMEDNEMLFKLKEMEYVEKIAEKISNISLSGSSKIVDQLRDIFVADK